MRHLSRSLPVRAAAAAGIVVSTLTVASGCGGRGSGGGGAATAVAQAARGVQGVANTGIQVIQQTVRQVQNIPQAVFDLANQTLTTNKSVSWGQPEMVVVHDAYYVLMYPTPEAERKRTGMPRMIVIPRNAQTDPQSAY